MSLLQIQHFSVFSDQQSKLLNDISLDIQKGEIIGITGESGSGKTTLGLSCIGMLADNLSTTGSLFFENKEAEFEHLRGKQISFITQNPRLALNPYNKIEQNFYETLQAHFQFTKEEQKEKIEKMMARLDLPNEFLKKYPHQLSGGQLQRIGIGLALITQPKLIIADEMTSALDYELAHKIMKMLIIQARAQKTALLLINHDISLLQDFTDKLYVFYAGEIVETGVTKDLLSQPAHPYTKALLNCMPDKNKQALEEIPGQVLPPKDRGHFCLFANRCEKATDKCKTHKPCMVNQVRCFYPEYEELLNAA